MAIEITDRLVQSLNWTLIHSLWQGMVLALFTGLLLTICRKQTAVFRYNLISSQLLLFGVACIATFFWEWRNFSAPNAFSETEGITLLNSSSLLALKENTLGYLTNNSRAILLIWGIVCCYKTLQAAYHLSYLQRASKSSVYSVPLLWQQQLAILKEKLGIHKTVVLLESQLIKVPMVIGHLKPIILLPIGLLSGLPVEQLEAILLHELAHIKRNDYWVNLMQVVFESIFFFNPAFLWLSNILRAEREHCCDDLAIPESQSKKAYLTALVNFKEYALNIGYAPTFSGHRSQLYSRVTRIIGIQRPSLPLKDKKFLLGSFLILSSLLAFNLINDYETKNKVLPQALSAVPKSVQHVKRVSKQASEVRLTKKKSALSTIDIQAADITKPTSEEPLIEAASLAVKEQIIAQSEYQKSMVQYQLDLIQLIKDREQYKIDLEQYKKDLIQFAKDQEQYKKDKEQLKKEKWYGNQQNLP
jgi:bla regulator protein BlaR1